MGVSERPDAGSFGQQMGGNNSHSMSNNQAFVGKNPVISLLSERPEPG